MNDISPKQPSESSKYPSSPRTQVLHPKTSENNSTKTQLIQPAQPPKSQQEQDISNQDNDKIDQINQAVPTMPNKKDQTIAQLPNIHKNETSESVAILPQNSIEDSGNKLKSDTNKYTIIYDSKTIHVSSTELKNDFRLFYSLSHYFQTFVRIKGQLEYKKDKIIPATNTKIELEKSFPLVEFGNKIYIFSDLDELKNFYEDKDLNIDSIYFNEKKFKNPTPDKFSKYAINNNLFNYHLRINTSKMTNVEFKIDGKTEKIKMIEGSSEEEQLEIIHEKYYNSCPFVILNINDDNEVNARIIIQDQNKKKYKEELKNRETTAYDFLEYIKNKYELKETETNINEKELNNKLVEINITESYLIIKNLEIFKLNIGNYKRKISSFNSIEKVLENYFPEEDNEYKYIMYDGRLILDKNQFAFKFAEKRIKIFDFKSNSITIKINCEHLKLEPIHIDAKNMQLLESYRNIKKEIINIAKINRDLNYLELKRDDKPIKDVVLLSKFKDDNGNYTIPFDLTIKKATFILKVNKSTYGKDFIDEKVSSLSKEFNCDNIKVYDVDNRLIDNSKSFLCLSPDIEYRVEIFDEYTFIPPISKKSKKENFQLELPRYDTFEHALSLQEETKDIPYLVYNGKNDVTKEKITEKISKENPLKLTINYEFHNMITKKDQPKDTDKLSANVLQFIANELLGVKAEMVEAFFVNNKKIKQVEKDDIFEDFDYKKGCKFDYKLLPPILQFKFKDSDIKDIENIRINDDMNIPESLGFKRRFPEEATIDDAKEEIRKEFNIKNDISFDGSNDLKDGKNLMSKLEESNIINIVIEPPEYSITFNKSDYKFRFKTNETIKDISKNPSFRSKIKPINLNHDMKFILITKEGEKELEDDHKIFEYYKEKDSKIKCVDLDPQYSFSFEKEIFETRIKDDTTFIDIKEIIKNHYKKLQNVLLNRIAFYDKNYKEIDESEKINTKFDRNNNEITVIFKNYLPPMNLNKPINLSEISPTAATSEFDLKSEISSLKKKISLLENDLNNAKSIINDQKNEIKNLKKHQEKQSESLKVKNFEILDGEDIDSLEKLCKIGSGGNSIVYKVSKPIIYALKEMNISVTYDNFRKFIQEYEILCQLLHPNIVSIFGIHLSDKNHPPSILLEYCPKTLEDIINKKEEGEKEISNVDIVFIIYQIVEGMKFVHSKKIIHRDLKPKNILIGKNGLVKISDFGIAKLMSAEDQSMTCGIGTQKFMAPEILNEEDKYDEKIDVYSFGVVLFFILTKGLMPKITIVQIGNGIKAQIPNNINSVSKNLINKCWNFDPKDRPSFKDIIDYIEEKNYSLVDLTESEIEEVKLKINQHNGIIPKY